MRRGKYVSRPLADRAGQPFGSAEEAWLWFCQCEAAKLDGARFRADQSEVERPCDVSDIYRAVIALNRKGVLGQGHLSVLGRFGRRMMPPDPWEDAGAAFLWREALDRLETVLRDKGIVG